MVKYLIVRSVKAELLPFYIEKWGKKIPNVKFDLLTHAPDVSSGVEVFENRFSKMINKIYIYNNNADFSFLTIPKELKKALKSEEYEGVLIPHKSDGVVGFTNVIIMAFLFSNAVYHGNIDGKLIKIPRIIIIKYIITSIIAGLIFLLVIPFVLLSIIKSSLSFYIKQTVLLVKSKYSW